MAKRKKSGSRNKTTCIVGNCNTVAKEGSKVCVGHLHPLRLQEEIERLRSTREGEWQGLLDRFPDLRRVGESLAVLAFRADPLKAAGISVIARSRGHGFDDGIVTLGEHIARPGYAAGTKQDEGRLGAGVAVIAGARRKLEGMLDPGESQPAPDPRPRCRRQTCPKPNVRQPVGARWCGFCGRDMWQDEESPADHPPASGKRSQKPVESPPTVTKVHEVVEAPTPPPATAVDEAQHQPASRAPLNGNGRRESRSIIVAAPTMHEAAKKGLTDARAMFSSLDVRSVLAVEQVDEGSKPERIRWKVSVLVQA